MIEILKVVIKALLSSLTDQEGKCVTGKDNKDSGQQDRNYNGAFYQAVTQLAIADSFSNIDMAHQNVAITNYGKRNHSVDVCEEEVRACFDEADNVIIPDSGNDDRSH